MSKQSKLLVATLSLLGAWLLTAENPQPRGYTIPTIDLSAQKHRQVIVDREKGQYLGHPAKAMIMKGKIELQLSEFKATAVRYGWLPFLEPRLNLINSSGLPAAPFAREVKPASSRQNADSTFSPNALVGQLGGGLFGPAAVGGGAGGAGVENFANADVNAIKGFGCTFFGEAAHGDEPIGFKKFYDAAQVRIARGHQGRGLGGWQFVRRAIAAGVFHEGQRTMVDNKVIGKKFLGRAEALAKQAPQPAAADFAARAGEAINGALGMFARGFADGGIDADPVAHSGHLAKGHTRLSHAEGPRVHSKENDFLWRTAGQVKVLLVRGPRVVERVINVLHRLGEGECVAGVAQFTRGIDYVISGHERAHSIGIFQNRKLNEINRTHRGAAYAV